MVDVTENIAFALLIRAEETEAKAKVEQTFERLAGAATVENVGQFYPVFNAACQEISTDHQQAAVRITMDHVRHLLGVEKLIPPTSEVVASEVASAAMLDALAARYQTGLDVDSERRRLLGATEQTIAQLRVDDLQGKLPEGSPSFYTAAKNAYVVEVANAINVMSSITKFSTLALNGGV